MLLSEKHASVEELSGLFRGSQAAFVLSYQGCTCEQLTSIRKDLRPHGASLAIIKNTLARKAVTDLSSKENLYTEQVCGDLTSKFKGPIAVVWAGEDFVSPAKVLTKHAKSVEKFSIVAGLVEGKVVDASGVDALANLPSKEELWSQLLSILNAPATKLVRMLNAPSTQLVRTIEAWRVELEKKV